MAQNINDFDKDEKSMELPLHTITSAKAEKQARNHQDS